MRHTNNALTALLLIFFSFLFRQSNETNETQTTRQILQAYNANFLCNDSARTAKFAINYWNP